jgi:hypothetical protein
LSHGVLKTPTRSGKHMEKSLNAPSADKSILLTVLGSVALAFLAIGVALALIDGGDDLPV